MSPDRRLLWILFAVASVAAAALLLWPRLERRLAPRPEAAWVAVEVGESGVAQVGRVEIEAGTKFTLHAVLEARDARDRAVYFTEASKLRLGDRLIEAPELRRWKGGRKAKILWFTVEGVSPFLPVESEADVARLRFEEYFRPEWSSAWSIPGSLEPRNDDRLEQEPRVHTFGIQRFHARVELYAPDRPLVPVARFKSWGAGDVVARVEEFSTVVARLPGNAGPVSAVFGLTQLEPTPGAPSEVKSRIAQLARQGLAFSRPWVLREVLELAGSGPGELSWRWVEMAASGLRWGTDIQPADLVRVGSRLVFLHRDGGGENVLDGADLCFDFEEGATVRRLDAVFEGDGVVELAPLVSSWATESLAVPATAAPRTKVSQQSADSRTAATAHGIGREAGSSPDR
jgi:hypothetical protein